MTAAEYHAADGISSTFLRLLAKHGTAKDAQWFAKNTVETETMLFGRIVHALVLEGIESPHGLGVAIKPAGMKFSTKEGKEWQKAHEAAAIMPEEDWKRAVAVRDAIFAHPIAGPLLRNKTAAEVSLFGTDELTGLPLKARLDLLSRSAPDDIPDLKVSAHVTPSAWRANVARERLDIQAAHYLAVAGLDALQASGWDLGFLWIVAEPTPPHRVRVYRASVGTLERGEKARRKLLDQLAAGEPEEGIGIIETPAWIGREEIETEEVG